MKLRIIKYYNKYFPQRKSLFMWNYFDYYKDSYRSYFNLEDAIAFLKKYENESRGNKKEVVWKNYCE